MRNDGKLSHSGSVKTGVSAVKDRGRTASIALVMLGVSLLGACATTDRQQVTDAIDDFIQVAELEEVDTIRTSSTEQVNYDELSYEYIILRTRRDYYLAKFVRRCYELRDRMPTPDVRHDPNTLQARFDTIRGCRIGNIYAIDKAQAEQHDYHGRAPGAKN